MDRKLKVRSEAMERLAYKMDYKFELKRDMGFSMFLSNFKLFKMGKKMPIFNVIHRKSKMGDFETLIFDFRYVVSTGKTTQIFRQTVTMFMNKKFGLPHFYMIPEKWYHRLGKYFGVEDIDFESYPKFSHEYYLKGEDESFIRHTFDQKEILSIFEQNTGYHLEGCNYVFILYNFNKLLSETEILDMLQIGSKLSIAFGAKGDSWLENHAEVMDLIKKENKS